VILQEGLVQHPAVEFHGMISVLKQHVEINPRFDGEQFPVDG